MNGSEITKCFHFQVNTLLLRHNFATNNSSVSSRQPPSHCPTDRVHTLLGSGDLLHPGHSAATCRLMIIENMGQHPICEKGVQDITSQ